MQAERSALSLSFVEPSAFNRIQIVLGGLDIFSKHWLTGIGYTNFQNYFASNYIEGALAMSLSSYEELGFTVSIHNWCVELLAEQGIIGLVGFCWLFFLFFRTLRQARRATTDKTLNALLIGHILMIFTFLFHGFFYHTFISQFFFWVMSGFALSTSAAVEREADSAGSVSQTISQ